MADPIDISRLVDQMRELPPDLRESQLQRLDLPLEQIEEIRIRLRASQVTVLPPSQGQTSAAELSSAESFQGERFAETMPPVLPLTDGETIYRESNLTDATDDLPAIPGYFVEAKISQGGMGIVLKARHEVLERWVAIKLPLMHMIETPAMRERFIREARSAAGLRHPNICQIYEVGNLRNRPFIAMSFIEGSTLSDWASRKKPSARDVASIISRLAAAVAYAHEHGVVHRDIKPANVLIDRETGEPTLTDFGLAKELSSVDVHATQAGQVMGTPAYMSPEQAAGRTDQLGPPTDIYSLGVVLYELLTGQLPLTGSVGELLSKVQTQEPVAPRKLNSKLHRDIETICLRAMAKEPSERYATAADLAEDLNRFSNGEPIVGKRDSTLAKIWRSARRNKPAAIAAGLLIMAGIGGSIIARSASRARESATIQRAIDAALDAPTFSVGDFSLTDDDVAKLASIDPSLASIQRARVIDRFATVVRAEISQPRLSDDAAGLIETHIEAVASRSPKVAAALSAELATRRRSWDDVCYLHAPFQDADALFPAGSFRPEKEYAEFLKYGDLLPVTPITGDVRAKLVLAAGWKASSTPSINFDEPGAIATGKQNPGYRFLILPLSSQAATQRASTEPSGTGSHAYEMMIMHGDVVLRRRQITLPNAGSEPLELSVAWEGQQIQYVVNNEPPIELDDPFALTTLAKDHLRFWLPGGSKVASIRCQVRHAPATPSVLERGDQLLAAGRFAEAADVYQSAVHLVGGQEVASEASFKRGYCYHMLQREQEAQAVLEPAALLEGNRWPLLASFSLWTIADAQHRVVDAQAILRYVLTRYTPEQIAREVSPEITDGLHAYCVNLLKSTGGNHDLPSAEMLDALKRSLSVQQMVDPQSSALLNLKTFLLSAYIESGNNMEAEQLCHDTIAPLTDADADAIPVTIVQEYVSLLLARHAPSEALELLNRFIHDGGPMQKSNLSELLVSRARTYWALNQTREAEADLNAYFSVASLDAGTVSNYLSACLVLGFLKKDQGQDQSAIDAWSRAAVSQLRQRFNGDFKFTPRAMFKAVMSSSLAHVLSDDDISVMVGSMFERSSYGPMHEMLNGSFFPIATLRSMWLTPRGIALDREWVLYDKRQLLELEQLFMYEVAGHDRGNEPVTPEEDAHLWECAGKASELLRHLDAKQKLQMYFALSGNMSFLGWGGLRTAIPQELQGFVELSLAKNYAAIGKPELVQAMLKTASDDSHADPILTGLIAARMGHTP